MKKLIALALTLVLALSLAACGGSGNNNSDNSDNSSEASDAGQIQTSSATDRWPSGVYGALGIPEYTAGRVVYAYPDDESGHVYIHETTREDLLAYVEELRAKGFRLSENAQERLENRSWESEEIYFPEPGNRYHLDLYFTFENDGAGSTEYFLLDEDDEEETEISFNVRFYLYDHGSTDGWGWNQTGLLEDYGIPDSAIMIENADQIVEEVESSGVPMMGGIGIDFVHDFELTAELWRPWEIRLLEACIAASDDGQALGTFTQEPIDVEAARASDYGLGGWLYNYNGSTYMVQLFAEAGYGETLSVMIQRLQ
jgi:hypothetical protein